MCAHSGFSWQRRWHAASFSTLLMVIRPVAPVICWLVAKQDTGVEKGLSGLGVFDFDLQGLGHFFAQGVLG